MQRNPRSQLEGKPLEQSPGNSECMWVLQAECGCWEAEVTQWAEEVARDHTWEKVRQGPQTCGCFQRSQEANKTIPSTFSRKPAASEEAGSQGGVPEWFCRSSVSHQNLVSYMLDEEQCVDELMWGIGDSAAPGPSPSAGPCWRFWEALQKGS